jgi:site-specific DNA-methyltransferase (adenine-specific)
MAHVGRPRIHPNDRTRWRVTQAASRARKAAALLAQLSPVTFGDCTIYCGDALQVVPLLEQQGPPWDHVLTDPPYEVEAHTMTRRTRAHLEGRLPYATIPFAPITDAQRQFVCSLQAQWLIVFCQVEAAGDYQDLLGKKYRRTCTWVKPDSAPQYTGDRPAQGQESIVCAWARPGRSRWNAGGKRGIYTHRVRDGHERLHPTQKPVPLLKELLQDFTQAGDVILDPFMGSGSTGIACLDMGRGFVGIEQAPETFAIARHRLDVWARQGRLFA